MFRVGTRVQMRDGWIRDADDLRLYSQRPTRVLTLGIVVGVTIAERTYNEDRRIGQPWVPVLWDDRDDPDLIKASALRAI